MTDGLNSPERVRVSKVQDDIQTLVTPYFNYSWHPSSVDSLGEDRITVFQQNLTTVMRCVRCASTPDIAMTPSAANPELAAAALRDMIWVDGSSVSYNDRNTRYTNMGGGDLWPEAIRPGLATDPVPKEHYTPYTLPNPVNQP